METAERFYHSEVERFIQELREVESLSKQSDEIIPDLFNKLLSAEKQMADSLQEIEDRLGGDLRLIEEAKIQFRQNIRPWYYQSLLMKRATEKPLGYPGDYQLLEAIYDNSPISKGFGRYLDHLLLNDQLAVAVRNRKDKIRTWLQIQFNQVGSQKAEFKILNIASGSCREWQELLSVVDSADVQLTCIDFDQRALDFAKNRLAGPGRLAHLEFLRDNALRMAVRRNNQDLFGLQDVIYSFGLYDYLSDKALKRLLKAQYDLLKPEGRMALTFKDKHKYEGNKHAWFCDWYFEQRGTQDVFDLLVEIGIDERCITTAWEKSDTIVFFQVSKEPRP